MKHTCLKKAQKVIKISPNPENPPFSKGGVRGDFKVKNGQIKSFCEKNNIELLIIFGSQASGKITPVSDFDVAVKLRKGAEA